MNTKIFLHFQPAHLFSKKPAVCLKELIKTPEGLTTAAQPLGRGPLKVHFKHFNEEVIKTLLTFSPAMLEKMKLTLERQYQDLSAPLEQKTLVQQAYERSVYKLFGNLRRLPIDDWYHSVTTGDNRMQNKKCSFYRYPVELRFKADQADGTITVNISVEIGAAQQPIEQFRQFDFLLEQDDCYYQLSPKSCEALECVRAHQLRKWTINQLPDLEKLLDQLDQKGVPVDRSGVVETEVVEVIPEVRVLLSELSNTFLKLEPQFVYDGIVVDGPFEALTKVEVGRRVIQIARNAPKEQELVGFLESLHEKFNTQRNGYFYLTFAEAQKKGWFLKAYYQLLDKNIDLLGVDLLRHFRYNPHVAETVFLQQPDEGDFSRIAFQVRFGKEKVPLRNLQKAMLNHQKAVLLKDGSLGVLGEDWIQKYGLLLRHGQLRNEDLMVPKWLTLGNVTGDASGGDALVKTDIGSEWLTKWHLWEQPETTLYSLPGGLKVSAVRPYQRKGYEWLRLLSEIGASACLADDMGLGKTLQTICFLLHRLEEQPQSKHLIVAPASLLYNWLKELEKFAPEVPTMVLHGSDRDHAFVDQREAMVVITSYGTLRQDIPVLETVGWDLIVLDESHHIKNPAALTTKAAWQLTGKTKIALSGTPIMNHTGDLHSQMHFLMPGLLGSSEFFKKEYAIPIEQEANEQKAMTLQKLIRPFLLRRTKEQVARDLPERTETVLWCEMGPDQRHAYETIKEAVRANVFTEIAASGLNKGKLSVLAGLTRLRQICNSAELLPNEDLVSSGSVKTKVLINELHNLIPQHRALVFSQFATMLDLLERDLEQAGIATLRLDGQTDVKKRQELVSTFQSAESSPAVFLISLKAGNTGLTLTKADYVFLFDPWWNTAVESQAIDRTHRIGQQQQVFAYRMICRDSIEEKILQMAGRKKRLADDLITTEQSLMQGLTMQDIEFLLA